MFGSSKGNGPPLPDYYAAAKQNRARIMGVSCPTCNLQVRLLSAVHEVAQRLPNRASFSVSGMHCDLCDAAVFNAENITLDLKPGMCTPCRKLFCAKCLQILASKQKK
jgi:hypothetical protein